MGTWSAKFSRPKFSRPRGAGHVRNCRRCARSFSITAQWTAQFGDFSLFRAPISWNRAVFKTYPCDPSCGPLADSGGENVERAKRSMPSVRYRDPLGNGRGENRLATLPGKYRGGMRFAAHKEGVNARLVTFLNSGEGDVSWTCSPKQNFHN